MTSPLHLGLNELSQLIHKIDKDRAVQVSTSWTDITLDISLEDHKMSLICIPLACQDMPKLSFCVDEGQMDGLGHYCDCWITGHLS